MHRLSSKTDIDKKLIRLGLAIRQRRREVGLSQEALAAGAGLERSNVGKIERGENNLSILNLVRIAEALNCKAATILLAAGL